MKPPGIDPETVRLVALTTTLPQTPHKSKYRKVLHTNIDANKYYRENQREDRYRPILKYENIPEKKFQNILNTPTTKGNKIIKHKTQNFQS